MAVVVTRPGVPTDEQDLLEHCRRELASFQVPARVVEVDALPAVGIGKLDRQALGALVAELLPEGSGGVLR